MDQEQQAQSQQEQVAAKENTKSTDLNVNDLIAMKNLIEIVTQRGAFKATELSAAGQLFDKLNAFVTAAEAAAKANQAQQEAQSPTQEAPATAPVQEQESA